MFTENVYDDILVREEDGRLFPVVFNFFPALRKKNQLFRKTAESTQLRACPVAPKLGLFRHVGGRWIEGGVFHHQAMEALKNREGGK